jgi:regulatory protein
MRWKKPSKTTEPENAGHAYDYAVFLLSLKLRTMGEVLEKMRGRGYAEQIIESVIERLKSQKYLDDERYAEIFLENLKAYKALGYFGIKKKFMEKKLPGSLIERVLDAGYSKEDEAEVGKRFLKKAGFEINRREVNSGIRYQAFAEEESKKNIQRIANRMKSRGFRSDVIAELLF